MAFLAHSTHTHTHTHCPTGQTLQYLQKRPCATQTAAGLVDALARLGAAFPALSLPERQAILNNTPTSNIELYILIDDIEGRFSAPDIQAILEVARGCTSC